MPECSLRALEFYSGIGGMHYGLQIGAPWANVVGAFEVHNVANDVYEHNFGWRPTQINLEGITAAALDSFRADIWLMSPPCQPFTRRGLQLHAADRRSASFVHLLEILPSLKHPPSYVLVENVVGFDQSPMCAQLHNALAAIGLCMQEFLVTPLQLGMPYSRPRYYALGRRKRLDDGSCSFPVPTLPSGKPFAGPPGPLLDSHQAGKEQGTAQRAEASDSHAAIAPISQYLDRASAHEKAPAECRPCPAAADSASERERQPVKLQAEQAEQATADNGHDESGTLDSLHRSSAPLLPQHNHVHGQNPAAGSGRHMPGPNEASARHEGTQELSNGAAYVPQNVIEQWGQSLDIVGPDSRRCNCFTKTYFRWVKGSGSVLATRNLHLVREREGMHAWDLSDEGGIHEHSQFLHLKLRSAAKLEASAAGTAMREDESLPANGADTEAEPLSEIPCEVSTLNSCTQPPQRSSLTKEKISSLGLRYFSPSEIARLHSFPESFSFPEHVTLRQQYALLGNSVSALVIGDLLRYLLHGSNP